MTHQVLIVDDERLARDELRELLAKHDNFKIVGEANSAAKAHRIAADSNPDLVFLDVEMPGASAFEFLQNSRGRFAVIFVTAYDQYALKAFDVDAVDYLVKPVSPARLNRALERFVERKSQSGKERLLPDDYVFLKQGDGASFVLVRSIEIIRADGDYTLIETGKPKPYRQLRSLKAWESRLPSTGFLRIHRSTIINLDYVDRVESWFNHSFRVFLKGREKPVRMSRRYAAQAKGLL